MSAFHYNIILATMMSVGLCSYSLTSLVVSESAREIENIIKKVIVKTNSK